MAASVVQSKTGAQNTGLATVAATWNTAATAGNLLIIVVGADDYAATPPTGFTESTGCKQETFLGSYLWWKVAAGGETSVNYTIGSASPSCWITAEISGLTSSPYDVSNGQFQQAASSSYTTPAITPTTGDRFLLAFMGFSLNNSFTSVDSWLNSFTEIQEINTTLGSGTRDQIGLASRAVTGDNSTTFSSGATSTSTGTPQSQTGVIIAFKVAAAGSNFTRTVDDSAGLVDAVAVLVVRVVTDAAGLTDTATAQLVLPRTVDDSAGLTDAAAVVSAFARTITDTTGAADAASAALAIVRTVTDGAGLSDVGAPQALDVSETITDAAGLSDTATPVLTPTGGNFTRTVDDSAGLTDTAAVASAFARTQNDPAGSADTVAPASAFTRAQTDPAGLADATSTQLAGAGTRQVDDAAGLADTVTYSSTQTLIDSLGPVDAVTLALAAARTSTDLLGLADTVTVQADRAITDSAGVTDTASTQLSVGSVITRTVTDSAGLTSVHRCVQRTRRPYSGVTYRYPLIPD